MDRSVLFSFGGVDGGPRVEVAVSDDHMAAWATFYHASSPEGKLLVWSEMLEALQNAGLVFGLDERVIQDAVFRFNTGHPSPETLVLARGRPAAAERPAFLKLEPRFFDHHFQDQAAVQIDFKEYSPFVIVKKGELLARAIAPRAGTPGSTVFGVEIPPGRKEVKHLKPGPHTLFAHGKVFSRLAGRFVLEGDVFDVSDTLEIDGVGYGTGNLVFPGRVIIKGVVSDGFRLAAGLDITVKGPLDASEVLCHGDLMVEGGVIGRKPGVVRVGGKVRTLYVEHCQLEALGDISVAKALLHARVSTNGDLSLDEGGRIVASTVWVRGTLTCGQLGGENGPVKVAAGTDFVVLRRLDTARAKFQALENEVAQARTKGNEPLQLLADLEALVAELNTLTPQLFSNPATEVRVVHKVFAGTVIEMGYASLTVAQDLKAQVFRLSPDGRAVVASPLPRAGEPASRAEGA